MASRTQFSFLPRISAAWAGVKQRSSRSAAVCLLASCSTTSARRRMRVASSTADRSVGVFWAGGARSFLVTGSLLVVMGDGVDWHVQTLGVEVEGPVTRSLLVTFDAGEVAGVSAYVLRELL